MTALGPGGEFDRLRGVFRRLAADAAVLGDDCAIVEVGGTALALSCDLAIEGHHFRRAWLSAAEIGWRATAAALSDLAAVAAEPAGILAAVGVPPDEPTTFLEDLMAGVRDAARATGAALWGGDLVAADVLTIDVTAVGLAGRPVRRRGAAVGDGVWVTGALGAPAAALRSWEGGQQPDPAARERFALPVPRIREAQWLRDRGATAMMDVSDGLVSDAGHLAAASGVALALVTDDVPVHPAAAGWEDGVLSGEEFELLVTMPGQFADSGTFSRELGVPLTRVGSVTAGDGVTWYREGNVIPVGTGFSHFP